MVHAGLCVLVVLTVVHTVCSQHTLNSQVAYRNVEHRSYMENVKLGSYGHRMQLPRALPVKQPEITETRIIQHPDEKIVHHPSPIYVKRPPTFVTINHPDIVIEPNPVVYHKPAAVVRSPVIYRNLPRKVEYRQIVQHVVKPIEQKFILEEKQPPRIFTQSSIANRKQHNFQRQYQVNQRSSDDGATKCVRCEHYNRRPTTNIVYQPDVITDSDGPKEEVMDDSVPLGYTNVYYKQSFPSSFQH